MTLSAGAREGDAAQARKVVQARWIDPTPEGVREE